jgi:predicted permease
LRKLGKDNGMQGWRHQIWLRLKTMWKRPQLDRDLDDEMAFHLSMRESKNRAAGIAAEEARHAAHRQFGNTMRLKERNREMWTFFSLETLWQDLRYGARMLRKNPGFTLTAVLTLALGIGANTAIFSVVDAVLLRPLPFPASNQLVRIWESRPQQGDFRNVVNGLNFLDWREQNHSFVSMAAVSVATVNLKINGEPLAVQGLSVSPEFFSVLRATPYLGRTFIAEDGIPGRDKNAILSYEFWQKQFGGRPDIVGRKLEVSGPAVEIVGVMPRGFSLPNQKADIWIPMAIVRSKDWEGGRFLTVLGRLRDGVTLREAEQDMARVGDFTAEQRPDHNKGWSAQVVPLLQDETHEVRRPLLVLLAAVGFVLLIACANVANLLLMRGTGRQRETAVRAALGASRTRIVQQLLLEGLLLSVAGTAVGVAFANWGLRGLLAMIPSSTPLPLIGAIEIDRRVFAFAFIVSVLTAIVFGLAPALRLSRVNLQDALKQGTSRTGVGGYRILRQSFVVVEIALAFVLMVGAGLMLRSFERILSVNPGFAAENVLTLHIFTSPAKYQDAQKRSQYVEQLLREIRNTPGVRSAGSTHFLPMTERTSDSCFAPADQPPPKPADAASARFQIVSSGYFATMGTQLLSGRDFSDRDSFGTPSVMIVNHAFVEEFLPHQDALGKKFWVCWSNPDPAEIVGVVADSRQNDLKEKPQSTIFLPNAQAPMYFADLVVRAQGDPRQIMRATEMAVHRVDPDQAVSGMQTMESVLSDSVSSPRFQLALLMIFAGIALVLAMIGVYGVISYSVRQRIPELGIRIALGARAADIAGMVLRETLFLTAIALTLGLASALILTRVLNTLLFEVTPTDPTTLLAVFCLVFCVAALSAFLPASRAMRVDPTIALRHE